jgi:AraC family transcriptional regulator
MQGYMHAIVDSSVKTAKVDIELRSYECREPHSSAFRCKDRCFIEFAITHRMSQARGCYEDVWEPTRSEMIGEVLFVPPGMRLRSSCEPGEQRGLACQIDADMFELDWGRLNDRALTESLSLNSHLVRRGLRRLLWEATHYAFARPLAVEAAAALLAVDIGRHLEGLQAQPERKTGGLSRTRMKMIEERVLSDQPLPTLGELAASCDLSARHLARAFREQTGRTVGEYVNAVGVQRAHDLLKSGGMPIKDVASRLGFASCASFSYSFRKATGLRPSDVRRGSARRSL